MNALLLSRLALTPSDTPTSEAGRTLALARALGRETVIVHPGRSLSGWHSRTMPYNPACWPGSRILKHFAFYLPANRRAVSAACNAIHPDVIAMTSVWDFRALHHFRHLPMVLDARRLERTTMETIHGPRAWISRLAAKTESLVLRSVDHVFCTSAELMSEFQERYAVSHDRLSVVPDGVDMPTHEVPAPFKTIPPRIQRKLEGKTVVFCTNPTEPSASAEIFSFLNTVLLPSLEQRAPGRFAWIWAGGKKPPTRVRHANLLHVADHAQCAALLARATLCLIPTLHKNAGPSPALDYFAARKPVITTPAGIRGISCAHKIHARVVESSDIPQEILYLATHPEAAAQLASGGHDFAALLYDWENLMPSWRRVIDRLVESAKTNT